MVSNTDLCKAKEKVRRTTEKSNRLSHVRYGAIGGDVKTVTKHRNNNEIAPKQFMEPIIKSNFSKTF